MSVFSILIPVYNSANCLQRTVTAVVNAMEKIHTDYEIVLVDDGSRDNSWEVVKQLKNTHGYIKGIRLSKNYGQHNAILCALNNCSGDIIITMDDDLEQNPDDVAVLYKKLVDEDHELVYGMPSNQKKNLFREFFTYLYKISSRLENKDAGKGSSFRIFKRSLKDKLIEHTGALFFIDEIALWYTDKIGYADVKYAKSGRSSSGYNSFSLFNLSLRVLSLSSTMPLRIVRLTGFFIFGFSIILGLIFIIRKLFIHVPTGYTSLMVAILFGTGVITASLGVIGEYLGNLIALSNNKPSYSIKEKT